MKKNILILSLLFLLNNAIAAGNEGEWIEGKKLFLTFCSACHGVQGRGDGEASLFLEKRPRDLTDQRVMFNRTDEELFNFINQGKFHGAKFIPQYKLQFEESQVWNIVAYIRSLSRQLPGNAIQGRRLYLAHCASCHGRDGKGDKEAAEFLKAKPPDLTNDSVMAKMTDRELYVIIAEGGNIIHESSIMPRWAGTLVPQQTWDIIAFLRLLHKLPAGSGNVEEGRRKFESNCSFCHGKDAKGSTEIVKIFDEPPPDLTSHIFLKKKTDLDLYLAILGGGEAVGHSEFMPSWGEVLSEQDIRDLIAFIRLSDKTIR